MTVDRPDDTGTEPYLGESEGEHPITPANQAAALAHLVQEGYLSQQGALVLTGGPLTGKRLTALDPAAQLNLVDAGLTPHGGQSEMTGVLTPAEVEANVRAIEERQYEVLSACVELARGAKCLSQILGKVRPVSPFELEYFTPPQQGFITSTGLFLPDDSEMMPESLQRLAYLQGDAATRQAALKILQEREAAAAQGSQEA